MTQKGDDQTGIDVDIRMQSEIEMPAAAMAETFWCTRVRW